MLAIAAVASCARRQTAALAAWRGLLAGRALCTSGPAESPAPKEAETELSRHIKTKILVRATPTLPAPLPR